MCTAATYQTKDFYIGRTLDYEFSYGDQITITRNYPFRFRYMGQMQSHYALIGMAHVAADYPLYYDAVNEKGVGMAGLNFVGNAVYESEKADRENVAQFEFIPWVLSQCASMKEVRTLLERINLTGTSFSPQLPTAGLHWIIADKDDCITVESMADGLHIYDNPVGILTNNPPFDMQMFQLNNYMSLSAKQPENSFAPELGLSSYSRGMGAMGLPGDLSSSSRFVRAAFVKQHSVSGESEAESVSQFSIFLVRWTSRGAAVMWARTSMRLRSIHPAVTPQRASIIIRPMRIIRSRRWICTAWILTESSL